MYARLSFLLATVALAAAPQAHAASGLVPFKSIGPVSLGQSLKQVQGEIPGYRSDPGRTIGGHGPWFLAFGRSGGVESITYGGTKYKTPHGTKVGMKVSQAAQHDPYVVCAGANRAGDDVPRFQLRHFSPERRPLTCGNYKRVGKKCLNWLFVFKLDNDRSKFHGTNRVDRMIVQEFPAIYGCPKWRPGTKG